MIDTRQTTHYRRLGFFILLVVSCSLFVAGQRAQAALPTELQQKITQTRQEKEALIEEERRLQAELSRITVEGRTLQGAVQTLDATKKKLANDIKLTQNKISGANLNIQALENSMSEKEREIRIHRESIATALAELSKYDSYSLVASLLTHEKISDVWRDRGSLEDLNNRLGEEINNLRETKSELEREKAEKEKTKQSLVGLQGELSGQKKVVEASQSAKARLLTETKSKEAEYQRLLRENLERQRQSEADLFRLESELSFALDPNLYPAPNNSVLAWPLDTVYITQRFGATLGASRLYRSGTHNGIDFRATVGTPVRAVLSGTVEGTGNTDEQRGCYSYGRWILIKHGNGLSSVYAHLSASTVSAGQSVRTGEVIGYSGGMPGASGSGHSTGPHLHLGLFASQGVRIRQFTTSIGCKSVFVPIADGVEVYLDPMAYLPVYR